MDKNFKKKYGQWAVVTGGTSGIGQSLTELIAEQGVNVVLVARRENVLAEKAKKIHKKYQVEVKTIQADLSKAEDIPKVIEQTKDIDVGLFIPCAGIENHGLMTEIPIEKELALLQLNVTSTFALSHHFANLLVKKGKGGIILVASTIAHMPNPYFSNYAGSKAYVLNFGLSLHWEMKQRGVDVMVLSPGYTTTPMTANFENEMDMSKIPFPKMTPEEVAKEAMNAFGKKPLVIPGSKNRLMIGMGRRLMSTKGSISMGGKMMEKVMNNN